MYQFYLMFGTSSPFDILQHVGSSDCQLESYVKQGSLDNW